MLKICSSKWRGCLYQWAGVQCAGNPHYWVDADGSYREEGQNNERGKIWGKVISYCSFSDLWCNWCFLNLFDWVQANFSSYMGGQASTKLLCSFLSLPVPSKGGNSHGEEINNMLNGAFPCFLEQRTLQKFFLVGYDGSGTSTIFKQVLQSLIYELFVFVLQL